MLPGPSLWVRAAAVSSHSHERLCALRSRCLGLSPRPTSSLPCLRAVPSSPVPQCPPLRSSMGRRQGTAGEVRDDAGKALRALPSRSEAPCPVIARSPVSVPPDELICRWSVSASLMTSVSVSVGLGDRVPPVLRRRGRGTGSGEESPFPPLSSYPPPFLGAGLQTPGAVEGGAGRSGAGPGMGSLVRVGGPGGSVGATCRVSWALEGLEPPGAAPKPPPPLVTHQLPPQRH